jgi:cytochrome b subunit of formate dehydrogenase
MLKRVLFISGLVVFILIVTLLWNHMLGKLFSPFQVFRTTRLIFLVTFIAGMIAGVIGATLKVAIQKRKNSQLLERHAIDSIMEHWGTGVGIIILIVSGFQIHYHGGLPAVKLHFLGIFITLLFGSYFLADFFVFKKYKALVPTMKDIIDGTIKKYLLRLKSKEPGKYLSSQKSSFLMFVILGALIVVSGVIKLLFFYNVISFRLLEIATKVHDISALLFVLVLTIHILLVIVRRSNWPLLRSWFNGKTPEAH